MRYYLTLAWLFFSFEAYSCPKTFVKQKTAVFSVGPSAVGKTTILKKLSECFTNSVFLANIPEAELDGKLAKFVAAKESQILVFDGDFAGILKSSAMQKWVESSKIKTHVLLFLAGQSVQLKRMIERGHDKDKKHTEVSPIATGTVMVKQMDYYRNLLKENPYLLQVNTELKVDDNVSKIFKIVTTH